MLKTKIIETEKVRILLVSGLPEDTGYVNLLFGDLFYSKEEGDWNTFIEHNMPKGNWQPLNFLDKINEDEIPERIIEMIGDIGPGDEYGFRNHLTGKVCDSRVESLHSLVEANVPLKNKYGEKKLFGEFSRYSEDSNGLLYIDPYRQNLYDKYLKDYEAEEEKVYHNPYLLIQMA